MGVQSKFQISSANFQDLELYVLIFKDGDFFIAFCPALNLSTYGDTVGDVKTAFDDLIASYIEDCTKNNSLFEDLEKLGWRFDDGEQKTYKLNPPREINLTGLELPGGLLQYQYFEPVKFPSPISF